MKKIIYFLDWLEENNFNSQLWLENMRPENQRWSLKKPFESIEEFIKTFRNSNWVWKSFLFNQSNLASIQEFENLINEWYKICNNHSNIKFSKDTIKDFKIVGNENLKIKFEGD